MRGRLIGLGVAALFAVAACGDGGGDGPSAFGSDTSDDAGDPGQAAGDDASDDGGGDSAQDVIDGLDFGDGAARVTLGDTSYEFALGGNSSIGSTTYLGVCQMLFGMIAGNGYDVDGRAITVAFEIPPVDWESYEDGRFDTSTPRIEIEDEETGRSWVADMQLEANFPELAGSSQIDEWVSDGTAASGSATFTEVEPFGAPVEGAQPVQGTFELGCGEDG